MRKLILLFCLFLLLSCSNNESQSRQDKADNATDSTAGQQGNAGNAGKEAPLTGCYLRALERDSLMARLTQDGNKISGTLHFDNYQKDGSRGTVEGSIEGEVVKLIYRFQAEGMSSISEVYFKRTPNGLIHGIGEVSVKGDSAYFTNPATISYLPEQELKKVDCAVIARK